MVSSSTDNRCLHCGAEVPPSEMAEGWCESCGKRLPSWLTDKAKRPKTTVAPPSVQDSAPARARSRLFLWGAVSLIVLAGVVLIVAR